MAKYRITSIPPLPKAQKGGKVKKVRTENKLKNFFSKLGSGSDMHLDMFSPDFFNEEEPVIQQNTNAPLVPVDELNDSDLHFNMYQPISEEVRASTLPTVWTQGTTIPAYTKEYRTKDSYLYNPISWNNYQNSLQKQLGISYDGPGAKMVTRTVDVPEQFIPDYSLGEDGQPLQCPKGKYPYKGQCFSEEMYIKLMQEEMDNEQYRFEQDRAEKRKKFEDDINQIRANAAEQHANYEKKRTEDYLTNFKNSKKSDKIDPYLTFQSYNVNLDEKIPLLDAEGNTVIDKKTGQPKYTTKRDDLKSAFLVIEDKKSGAVKLYPKEIVYDRIVNNGFQAEQFKNIWGLDPKQVKEQVGDIMSAAKAQYDATMKQKILDKALSQGKSIEEVVASLPRKLVTKEGAQSFIAPTQKILDDAYNEFVEKSLAEIQKNVGVTVDKDGTTRYDFSKEKEKQNVDFDFENDIYVDEYDGSGKLVSREVDPIKNYAYKWAESAKTPKEKLERMNKINAIYSKDRNSTKSETYKKYGLDASGNVNHFGDMSIDQINKTYGDTFQQDKIAYGNLNALGIKNSARQAVDAALKEEIDDELIKLTNFGEDFGKFMKEINRHSLYNVYRGALNDPNISYEDKARVLNLIKNKNADGAISYLMSRDLPSGPNEEPTINYKPRSTYNTYLSEVLGGKGYSDYLSADKVTAGKPDQEIGVGTKVWDVLTNPGDALYYALNGRGEEMWGNWNKSYNERKEAERKFGTDLGTYKDYGPMTMVLDMANTLNPLNWGDEMTRAYEANGLEGLSNRSAELGQNAVMTASMFIPGGQTLSLLNEANALRTAANAGSNLNKFLRGVNALERGVNSLGVPGQYLVNLGRRSMPLLAYNALRPYGELHTGVKDIFDGKTAEGLENIAWGTLGALPAFTTAKNLLKYGQTPTRFTNLGVTSPSGKYYGFRATENPTDDLAYAISNQALAENLGLTDKSVYKSAFKNLHPDVSAYPQELANLGSKNLVSLTTPPTKAGQVPGFNRVYPMQVSTGRVGSFEMPGFNFGKGYKFNIGQNYFKPQTLEQLLLKPTPATYHFTPPASRTTVPSQNLLGYKNGGSLPKYQLAGIVKGLKTLAPIASEVSTLENIATTIPSLANITRSVPVVNILPGYQERRDVVQSLKNLGYLGPETMGMDMLKAAKSDESLNKLMQLAIDFDRTGYRQVTGDFKPIGSLLGGYGGSGRTYNMFQQNYGAPRSEFENMGLAGVDPADPISLGAYQATHIPMEQYGYRAGLPDMTKTDGLYLASLPGKQEYGPYQFKVKQNLDFDSGNWQDWYNEYIIGKQPLFDAENYLRRDLQPSNLYFNVGSSKGQPGKLLGSSGVARGTGLNTRQWVSGKGNQIGVIDPTFKFTNLKDMSLEDYLEMENYKNSLIKQFNTGWRGQYQRGGVTTQLTQDEIDQYVNGGYIVEEE
jgi:hypothetical protein